MEMASAGSSMTDESGGSNNASAAATAASPTGDQSVNGLKFGKKIYFEDDHVSGGGAPIKPRITGSSSSTSGSGGARGRKGQGGQQQPPRCQVEGCKVDLTGAKSYYSRHKVCGMHSKYPKVIVAGLEQRFCQQCSRFHQLPEFDQGKRSCRRRLAGHNERRRKPPPGSVLSSRYGQFSPAMFGNSSRAGGFLMDFSAYSRQAGRDGPENNQTAATGRSVPHSWQSSSQNAPSNPYLQGATGGTCVSSSGVSSGECFAGISVPDSSCALSLLSNQPWGCRNRGSGLGVNDLLNAEGPSVAQSTDPRGAAVNQYPNPSWSFKRNEESGNSHDMRPDLALGQISPPFNSQHEPSQQNRTQYMEIQNSRAYDSAAHHTHWSL